PGAAKYETGTFPNSLALCSYTSLQYIEKLGLANIRAHARQLTDRLQTELPAIGYPSVTPKGNETPIVAFELKDVAATQQKLGQAGVTATIIESERRLRLAVSVFNNHEDIDTVVKALSSWEPARARGTGTADAVARDHLSGGYERVCRVDFRLTLDADPLEDRQQLLAEPPECFIG